MFFVAAVLALCVSRADAATVTGRVLSPDGQPVAGATVWIWESAAFEPPSATTAKTDADGRYALSYEPPTADGGRVTIGAVAEGLGAGARPVTSPTEPLDVPLRAECVLTVKLLDAAAGNAPVAGVAVKVRGVVISGMTDMSFEFIEAPADTSFFSARTDQDGVAVIHGLPRAARALIDVDDDRFARLTYDDAVLLPNEATFTAPPTTLRPAAVVRGRVTYDGTSKPALGVRVSLQGVGRQQGGGTAVTDPDGHYRVARMPAGQFVVSLYLDPALAKDWTARAIDGLELAAGEDAADTDLKLVTGSLITGHVRDDTGKGIADVPIGLYGPARPRSAAAINRAVSEADGAYSIRTPAGEQYVYVQTSAPPKGYQMPPEAERNRTVTTTDGQTMTIDFTFERATADSVVKGLVVFEDGRPVSGASVMVESDRQQFAASAVSDADGRFELSRERGDTSFRMRARKDKLATPAAVAPAADGSVTLRLRADALHSAAGKVVDADGKPVAGAILSLTQMTGQYGFGRDVGMTDADGAFSIADLWPDGRYTVNATAKGFGKRQMQLKLGGSKTLVLPPLVIKRLDSFVAGTVFDADGGPAADVDVTAMGPESGMASARTDAAGQFRFPTIAGETIRLYAHVSSEKPQRSGEATATSGDDRATILLDEPADR
jgi:hypothetical protein